MKTKAIEPVLAVCPGAPGPAFKIAVHALQEELLGVSAQIQNALHPQNVFAEFSDQ